MNRCRNRMSMLNIKSFFKSLQKCFGRSFLLLHSILESLSLLTFLHVIHTSVKGSKKIWKQGKLDCRGMSKIIFIYQEAFVNTILIIIFFIPVWCSEEKIHSIKCKFIHHFILWIIKITLTIFIVKPPQSKMKKNKIFVSAFIQNDRRFTVCSFCSFVSQ